MVNETGHIFARTWSFMLKIQLFSLAPRITHGMQRCGKCCDNFPLHVLPRNAFLLFLLHINHTSSTISRHLSTTLLLSPPKWPPDNYTTTTSLMHTLPPVDAHLSHYAESHSSSHPLCTTSVCAEAWVSPAIFQAIIRGDLLYNGLLGFLFRTPLTFTSPYKI